MGGGTERDPCCSSALRKPCAASPLRSQSARSWLARELRERGEKRPHASLACGGEDEDGLVGGVALDDAEDSAWEAETDATCS